MKPTLVYQRDEFLVGNSVHEFTAEASSLRWAPGEWPEKFIVEPKFGNGQPFYKIGGPTPYGFCMYRQELGCVYIKVFND